MRTGLTRFFTSVTLMLGIVAMLSVVKKDVLFIERPKVEVSEWEVIDQRSMKKLFKVASQDHNAILPIFSKSFQGDSSALFPKVNNHSKRAVY